MRPQPNPYTVALAKLRRAECYVCHRNEGDPDGTGHELDVRPYGVNGAWICFPCMKDDPEREAEAQRQFSAQFTAAARESGLVAIGEPTGPRPLGDCEFTTREVE